MAKYLLDAHVLGCTIRQHPVDLYMHWQFEKRSFHEWRLTWGVIGRTCIVPKRAHAYYYYTSLNHFKQHWREMLSTVLYFTFHKQHLHHDYFDINFSIGLPQSSAWMILLPKDYSAAGAFFQDSVFSSHSSAKKLKMICLFSSVSYGGRKLGGKKCVILVRSVNK